MVNSRVDEAIEQANAPAIPSVRFRPVDLDGDMPALSGLIVETNLADHDDYLPSVDELRNDLEHQAYFDAARDVRLASVDGVLVGAAIRWPRVRAGVVQHELEGWVRPTHRRGGLGRALLRWSEARSREAAAEWAGPERHVFTSWVNDTNSGAIALLESEGYRPVRYGFLMVRSLADPIPHVPVPEGLEVRPVVGADHRRIWDADTEAFRDGWEPADRTEEDFIGWYSTPGIDTSMWRVAWDGNEVAGSVMNFAFQDSIEKLGIRRAWLEHVSVRGPWRRRGLAGSLIASSLHELRARGYEEAALGVDAENPSGALRLYESFGFRRHRTGIAFRREF